VYDLERRKLALARNEIRSLSQGTGDRSDKIRTYNFPQDRVTDHRANFTTNGVERVLEGENLDVIVDALLAADERVRVESFLENLVNGKAKRY
jgi:peptide chain release factor 1